MRSVFSGVVTSLISSVNLQQNAGVRGDVGAIDLRAVSHRVLQGGHADVVLGLLVAVATLPVGTGGAGSSSCTSGRADEASGAVEMSTLSWSARNADCLL